MLQTKRLQRNSKKTTWQKIRALFVEIKKNKSKKQFKNQTS